MHKLKKNCLVNPLLNHHPMMTNVIFTQENGVPLKTLKNKCQNSNQSVVKIPPIGGIFFYVHKNYGIIDDEVSDLNNNQLNRTIKTEYTDGFLFGHFLKLYELFGDDDDLPYYTNMGRFKEAIIATPAMIKKFDKIQHNIDEFYQR